MTIIPAIDLINGQCVRLTHGDFLQKTVYSNNPLELALQFEEAGFTRLHLVDLDGAKSGTIVNLKILESIASNTKLIIDFGGGIKKIEDVESILNAGAAIVTIGSMAVTHPEILEEWLLEFGAIKFLIAADVLDGKIKINGWLNDGRIDVFSFIGRMNGLGVTNIFCTDISKDGALQGPSTELYKQIMGQYPEINLVASGGVSNMKDVLLLKEIGCKAAIIGKAIYEGKVGLLELAAVNN